MNIEIPEFASVEDTLCSVTAALEAVKNTLADISFEMEPDSDACESLTDALDALDDAIDSINDAVDTIEEEELQLDEEAEAEEEEDIEGGVRINIHIGTKK